MPTVKVLGKITKHERVQISKAKITNLEIKELSNNGNTIADLMLADETGTARGKIFATSDEDIKVIKALKAGQVIAFSGTTEHDGFEHSLTIVIKEYRILNN
ncbi:OB-fold nucleic acid binding domain-containing protein [Paenibacillus sp. Leaf72]|uniref:OB-fold nucleic acid binding domain-containing protein n=1 Tax=Paenibacillus sp. Leaf72 TaxID=1736234 RepID=UPI0006F204DD|nr:OB-fold nucleic acid binding domain-containing protein [Paenibacillus sp. Leaf72]KQN96878.1 hypothetical protein ASF12_22680 [Paenibacillus sp. Leaf72]